MFSAPMTRAELAEQLPALPTKKAQREALAQFIRDQKAAGRLIERSIFVEPAASRRRGRVFQFVAINLELPLDRES